MDRASHGRYIPLLQRRYFPLLQSRYILLLQSRYIQYLLQSRYIYLFQSRYIPLLQSKYIPLLQTSQCCFSFQYFQHQLNLDLSFQKGTTASTPGCPKTRLFLADILVAVVASNLESSFLYPSELLRCHFPSFSTGFENKRKISPSTSHSYYISHFPEY